MGCGRTNGGRKLDVTRRIAMPCSEIAKISAGTQANQGLSRRHTCIVT